MDSKPAGSTGKGPGRSPRVPRNAACTNCRRRKMKCDGRRPMCGPCSSSSGALADCEFGDRGGTRADALEEQISILENRLRELENPGDPHSSMALYNPYSTARTRPSTPALERSIQVANSHGNGLENIPSTLRRILLDAFLPHAAELGFFLDPAQFAATALSSSNPSIRALLSTVFLLGAHLSDNREIQFNEPTYLAYAVQAVSQGLSENHPQRVIHTIQAYILLSQYFFLNSRSLEGNYNLSTAIALVLSAGLHKIRSLDNSVTSPYSSGTASGLLQRQRLTMLPPPRDVKEEGQRINAMWTVLAINSCWTTAENSPSYIPCGVPEGRIDTPWPMDIGSYSTALFPDELRSSFTVQNFLANTPDQGYSVLALYAKASILFEQCTATQQRYSTNMSLEISQSFSSSFESLDVLVARFVSELAPVESASSLPVAKRLLVIHTLARVAMIQLHYKFFDQHVRSHTRILTSANEAVRLMKSIPWHNVTVIDPIMAILWVTIGQVLIHEIITIRSSRNAYSPSMNGREIATNVESVIQTMSGLAQRSPLMEAQLGILREHYAAAMSR